MSVSSLTHRKRNSSARFRTFPRSCLTSVLIGNIPQKASKKLVRRVSERFRTFPLPHARLCTSCSICSWLSGRVPKPKGRCGMREYTVSVSRAAISAAERQRRLAKVYKLLIALARKRRAVSQDEISRAASKMDGAQSATG